MKIDFYLQRIRDEFPEIEWKSYQYLTNGWDHDVIILDEKIVIRASKDVHYQNYFTSEIELLNYLKPKLKVSIPEYRFFSKDHSLAGYDILKGKELNVSLFKRLTITDKESVAKQIAEFINTLHATPREIINRCKIEIGDPKKHYDAFLRDIRKILLPKLAKEDIQLIEEYFTELKGSLDYIYSKSLVHNDLTDEHILWDSKQKQINIIDFSDCSYGDPAIDFASLLCYGTDFTNRVFDLYNGEKDEHLLQRAMLYFKRCPIGLMMDSFIGFPCTFEDGYILFKERFKITEKHAKLPNG